MYFILVLVGSPLFRFARQTPTFFNSRMLYAGGFLYSPNHLRFANALHWRHSLYLRPVFPKTPFVPCSLHSLISFLPIFPTIGRTDIIRFASALGWGCAPLLLHDSYIPKTPIAPCSLCLRSPNFVRLVKKHTPFANALRRWLLLFFLYYPWPRKCNWGEEYGRGTVSTGYAILKSLISRS